MAKLDQNCDIPTFKECKTFHLACKFQIGLCRHLDLKRISNVRNNSHSRVQIFFSPLTKFPRRPLCSLSGCSFRREAQNFSSSRCHVRVQVLEDIFCGSRLKICSVRLPRPLEQVQRWNI